MVAPLSIARVVWDTLALVNPLPPTQLNFGIIYLPDWIMANTYSIFGPNHGNTVASRILRSDVFGFSFVISSLSLCHWENEFIPWHNENPAFESGLTCGKLGLFP